MGEVKDQGDIVDPVFNRCTSFLFHVNKVTGPTIPIKYDQGDIAAKFCSDWMNASSFIVHTIKFLFISATAVTLG